MKKILFILTLILVTGTFVMAQVPVINSFSPTTGLVGSTVTITGSGFDGSSPSNNQVFFGSAQATVLTASFGSLTVAVPAGSTTNLISVRNVTSKLIGYSNNHFNGIFCSTPLNATTYNTFNQQLGGISGAYNIDIYDIDGDGKSDIITGNNSSGITIARNQSIVGTMNFVAYNINTSANVQQFFVADFDGDGKRDIVISGGSGTFLFPNTSVPGTVSFGARIIINTSRSYYQCAAGDLNNDGKVDFVGGGSDHQLYTFRNTSTGPGNFTFVASTVLVSPGALSRGLQCVDLDGDGVTDIVGTTWDGQRMYTLRNTTPALNTTFSFATRQDFLCPGFPYRLKLGDFDKDGKIDLVTPLYNSSQTGLFRNTSTTGTISFAPLTTFTASFQNYRVGVGDVNGDGFPDMVTKPNGIGAFFQVYKNISSGPGNINFDPPITYNSAAGAEVGGIAIGDMDGDLVPDIATSGISTSVIRFHRNTSSQPDNTPPTAACKNITVALGTNGTVTVTGAMIDNGSADACGLAPFLINGLATVTYTCADIGTHTVTLTVTDLANNTATCTATVTIAPAAIIVSGQTTVCQGQTVLLQANLGGSYQWYLDGNPIGGATSQTYSAAVSGSYNVEVINNPPGCSGVSDPVFVTVNNNPTVNVTPSGITYLCPPGNNALLTASLSSIYQWKLNNVNISGATQQTYSATTPGSYTVQVIDVFGCSATSDAVIVLANPPEIDIKGNGISITDGDNSPSIADDTDFGTTYPSTPVVKTYTIDNTGINNLIVSSISISGADAANFTLGGISLPATIASGGSLTFTVTFNGTAIQVYNAEVTLNNDDCNEAVYNYAIRAEISCVPPTITCPPNVVVNNNQGMCGAVVNFSAGMFASNGGAAVNGDDGGAIMTVDKLTAASTVVGTPAPGHGITGIDFSSNGTLYGIKVNNPGGAAELIIINPATGALINNIGTITLNGSPINITDMAIQPGTNTIYCATTSNQLVTVNAATAVATFIGQPVPAGSFLSIAFAPNNTLYGLRTNQASNLLTINPSNGTVLTNTVLSISIGAVGLGVDPLTGLIYASECCTVGPGLGNILYRIDPATGNNTLIGSFGGTRRVQDIAFKTGASATGIPVPVITYSPPSGSFFPVGTTTVTATATSSCGTATCTFTVTVNDNQPPVITCPAPITIQCDTPVPGPDINSIVVTDNCNAGITVTWEGDQVTPGNCPSNFIITRTYKAKDASNNVATCTQTITVVDNTAPTLTVPANVTLQCTDPLPLMPLNINSSPNFIDGTYNVGTAIFGAPLTATPLTADAVMVIDDAGNPYDACENITNNLTGKIAVIERSGCTPPASFFVTKAYKAQLAGAVGVIFIFNQPGNQVVTMGLPPGPNPTITIPLMLVSNSYGNTLKAEILAGPVNVSLSAPTVIANDACSFAAITHQQTFTPGNCPSNYTLVNTWTATDQCGNATTASQTITVVDNTPPTLTVPANVTLQCSDPLPLMPLNINSSPNAIAGTYNVGTAVFGAPLTATPLTADAVMVIDDAGNPYDACENITNNLTGKIAVIERSGCTPPASFFVTKANKAQLAGAVGVIFIFNQPGNNVVTMGLPPGPNPTITIPLMLVSNTYGNTLKAEILAGAVNVSLSAPTVIANDACSFAAITHQQTITPGNCPSNYTLVNTWTATDQCGNATTKSQTITVVDNTEPVITCPADITVNNATGQCGANVSFAATGTDNCGTPVITYSHNPGSFFAVGTTIVTATATDACNNTSQCTFRVIVNDNEKPVINVSNIARCYADDNFGCSINLGATATDNCSVQSLTSNTPTCFPVGTTTVTWTATDIYGNVSTATQLVTRNPEININICAGPTRTIYTGTTSNVGPFGPQSVNLTSVVTGGTPGYSYKWTPSTGLNNALIANPVASPTVTTVYTLTVTDSKGCKRSLNITINVLPLSAAVCSGSGNNVKFSVCHIPPGNPSNAHNICISVNALNAHLTSGSNGHNNCYLGPCQQNCFSTTPGSTSLITTTQPVEDEIVEAPIVEVQQPDFRVNVYPNPTAYDFSIQVLSKSNEPITIRILDINGKVISVGTAFSKGNNIKVGANLQGGTYIAEVIQGTNRQTVKLVKLN